MSIHNIDKSQLMKGLLDHLPIAERETDGRVWLDCKVTVSFALKDGGYMWRFELQSKGGEVRIMDVPLGLSNSFTLEGVRVLVTPTLT